jgi:hypothetical protein
VNVDLGGGVSTLACLAALLPLGGDLFKIIEVEDVWRCEARIVEYTLLRCASPIFVLLVLRAR